MQGNGNFQALPQGVRTALTSAMSHAGSSEVAQAIQNAGSSDSMFLAATQGTPGRLGPERRAADVQAVVTDGRFAGLKPELQQAVIESAALGRATPAELMSAATFTPGPGFQLTGLRAQQAPFLDMVRRTMIRADDFRGKMERQNARGATPISMEIIQHRPGINVDASLAETSGPHAGEFRGKHLVSVQNLLQFPAAPTRSNPNGTTQDQNVIHFMREAINESKHGAFQHAHENGIKSENKYRQAMGQKGTSVDASWDPRDPSKMIFFYKDGHQNETLSFDERGKLSQIY